MKRLFAMLLLLAVAGLSWVSAAPAAEDATTPPYAQWTGTFVLAPNVPFVWLRQTPVATASIVGSQLSGTRLSALIPAGTSGMIFEPSNSQWWGFVSDGRIQGWVELKSLVQYVPPTPTLPPPTATPAPPTAQTWAAGSQVRVKASMSFVWLRAAAGSSGAIAGTYFPKRLFTVLGAPTNDGTQFWWQVRDVVSGQGGWLEQNALESVSQPSGALSPDGWKVSDVVRVRAQVSFVWLRPSPASNAGILATVRAGGQLWLSEARQSDGAQFWWRVQIPNSSVVGWVEESALEFVRKG
jgi:hypothetical protein